MCKDCSQKYPYLITTIYGPSARALDAETPQSKNSKKENGRKICVCFTDVHPILHARSCNHFL